MTWKITGAPGAGDDLLYSQAGTPTLDLRFASSKSLVDNISGQNLVDFTRGGNGVGTYVGSDGLIKNSVVNLLTYSEDFENIAWQTTSPSEVTLITGVADPAGGNNATTFYRDSGAGDTGWLRRIISGTSGQPYTFSFWARRRTGTGNLLAVIGDNVNQTINGVTSSWQRFSIVNTPTSSTVRSYFKVDDTGDQFDIWGAQLEASNTVGEYVKTTSSISGAPRFDHDPETGESLGLLIEEQRTNLVLRSEEFGDAYWTKTNSSVSDNAAISPNGTQTADKLNANTTNGIHAVRRDETVLASTTYTVSFFAKAGEYSFLAINHGHTLIADYHTFFDLSNGTIGTSAAGNTATIQPLSNGWYRCSVTRTTAVSQTSISARALACQSDNVTSFVGSVDSGIYIWGAQLEAGSFPTSYIPTTGAAVTRSADLPSITGTNFSNWYRQDEGTVFANWLSYGANQYNTVYNFNGATGNSNVFELYRNNSETSLVGRVRDGSGSNDVIPMSIAAWTGSRHKAAHGLALNNTASCVNGGTVVVDSSVNTPSNIRLHLGGDQVFSTGKMLSGTIHRLVYFDRRLPDATLQTITA